MPRVAASIVFLSALFLFFYYQRQEQASSAEFINENASQIKISPAPVKPQTQEARDKAIAAMEVKPADESVADTDPEIAALISKHHYRRPDYQAALQASSNRTALERFLNSLDPYSELISDQQLQFTEIRSKESRIGPGLDYLFNEGVILGVPVFAGPLYRQGFKNAFIIHRVMGKSIAFDDFDTYRFLLGISPGDMIDIEIQTRPLSRTETLEIPADRYHRDPVRFYTSGNTTVLEIKNFRAGYTKEVKSALQESRHSKRLIIDLRFSPGGDVYAMTDWLSLFLAQEQAVARLMTSNPETSLILKTLSGKVDLNLPVVLLVSAYTASSAEIFGHALKTGLNNTVIAGQASKGKCLAQTIFGLKDENGLKLSTYEVRLANGEICHGKPLQPDISIPDIEYLSMEEVIGFMGN